MMKRRWAVAGLLSSAIVSAQTSEPPPPVFQVPPPPQAVAPPPPPAASTEVDSHQAAAARLKSEREALAQECDQMQKAIGEAREDAAETARLRLRLVELQSQLAKKNASASKPVKATPSADAASKEDPLTLYRTASNLRQLGKLDEAAAKYREVVNSHTDDEMLLDGARIQLEAIATRRALERQLAEIRTGSEGK
jgi:hypothetical protein